MKLREALEMAQAVLIEHPESKDYTKTDRALAYRTLVKWYDKFLWHLEGDIADIQASIQADEKKQAELRAECTDSKPPFVISRNGIHYYTEDGILFEGPFRRAQNVIDHMDRKKHEIIRRH